MRSAVTLLASIPSPSSGTLDLGPVTIHMYGLMLLAGIAACIAITGVRWVARGGDWDLIFRVAVWGVGAGIVGARLYHLATSWSEVPDDWWGPVCSLGRRARDLGRDRRRRPRRRDRRPPRRRERDRAARRGSAGPPRGTGDRPRRQLVEPGALRRADEAALGGLEIDTARRPDQYIFNETFHPTFLYEALWNLLAAGVLLLLDRRYRFRPPALFALYIVLYTGFRFYLETLRIDPSKEFAGLRVNAWVSLILFVASLAFFIYWQFFRGRRDQPARRGGPRRIEPKQTMAVPSGRVRPRR